MSFNSAVVHPKRPTGWLFRSGVHGHVVGFVANVNSRSIGMDHLQAEFVGLYFPGAESALPCHPRASCGSTAQLR
jgi:hypothetical protein